MRHILKSTFFVFLIVFGFGGGLVTANAQSDELKDHPLIQSSYKIPDHRGDAARIKARIASIAAYIDELEKPDVTSPTTSLDDALDGLSLSRDPQTMRDRYEDELTLYRSQTSASAWATYGRTRLYRRSNDDAAGAAWESHRLAVTKRERSTSLALMAEAYEQKGDDVTALNLYYLAWKTYNRNGNARYRARQLGEATQMLIKDISVDPNKSAPTACVVFNHPLQNPLPLEPEDYVSLKPGGNVDIYAQGDRICMRGLVHGREYEIEVRKGVPSQTGYDLAKSRKREFTVQNMDPRITFSSNAYVLPKSSGDAVPVRTVNLDQAKLSLYQIKDRNLVNGIHEGMTVGKLNRGSENRISSTVGTKLWEGTVDINSKMNKEVVTLIPLSEMLEKREPGIYALVARQLNDRNNYYWRDQETQWILVSDIGMTSFQGLDGLDVMIRSLETARPKGNVTLTLIARNNEILGRSRTNGQGLARFAPGLLRGKGGDAPALLTAQTARDYNFLNLSRTSLDLSERGISGRTVREELDAFLYTERGVYRPGEKVFLSALVRDRDSRAVGDVPVTLKITRPDGTEMLKKTLTIDEFGGATFEYETSPSARAGQWRAALYLGEEEDQIGYAYFQVEDFVPQRIAAEINTELEYVEPETQYGLDLSARFLYGPPAADLKTEITRTVTSVRSPFAKHRDFRFGLIQEQSYNKRLPELTLRTDESGKLTIPVDFKAPTSTTLPLALSVTAAVFDVNGRPVYARTALPIRSRDVEVGLRRNKDASFEENEEAGFDLVALDKAGDPIEGRKIRYEWIREYHEYSWYYSRGNWQTRHSVYDETIDGGEVETDAKGMATLSHVMTSGRYRLEIKDADGTSAASERFYVGWWSSSRSPDVPDELEIALEESDVASGDNIKAFVKAPFEGEAFVAVMGDGLLDFKSIHLPKDGAEVSIKARKEWAPGAYLLVTAFRPQDGKPSKLPARAMGLKWVSVDKESRTLNVAFDLPESVLPRQEVTLPFEVSGNRVNGKKLKITIAAVDEGILRLTNFQTPDPSNFYNGQRRLAVTIRDLYGRLIETLEGSRGKLRTGGDVEEIMVAGARAKREESNTGAMRARSTKAVSLFTREVTVDGSGKGSVTLKLPDFNGRLRLMAVAYSEEATGKGQGDLVVRDPVVADLLLPRFLAPGDRSDTTLTLHNIDLDIDKVRVKIESGSHVDVSRAATFDVDLPKGERKDVMVPLLAKSVGVSEFKLTVTGEGLETIERDWKIEVRPAQPFITDRSLALLSGGQSKAYDSKAIAGYLDGTVKGSLTLAVRPDFDVPGLLDDLDRYPYGCTEQTISRAMPLLYLNDVAKDYDKSLDQLDLDLKVTHAIARVFDKQRFSGDFSVWQSGGDGHAWLTAYAVDFLTRAQEKDYDVSSAGFDHAREWLKNFVASPKKGSLYAQAYAYYVLARLGDVKASDVRYFASEYGDDVRTPVGKGHLAAALAILGERKMAEQLFVKAIATTRPSYKTYIPDYGTEDRDRSALLFLISESLGNDLRVQKLADIIDKSFAEKTYMSTQEQAWLLMATHALSADAGETHAEVAGKVWGPRKGAIRLALSGQALEDGVDVKNLGDGAMRSIFFARGVPSEPLPVESNGFTISRTIFTPEGAIADTGNIRQNDLFVILVEGKVTTKAQHEALVVDMLPAGFEIENMAIGGEGGLDRYRFLPALSRTEFFAARDDRYVAAINLAPHTKGFAIAYVVRAVTPGTFALPGSFVEDMYKPEYRARAAIGELVISKAE